MPNFKPTNSVTNLSDGTEIKQGDTNSIFRFQLLNEDGSPADLTDCTVTGYFVNVSTNTLVFEKELTVEDNGTVSFHFDDGEVTGTGQIEIQFNVTYKDNTVQKFPADDYAYIMVNPPIDNLQHVALSTVTIDQLRQDLTNAFSGAIENLQNGSNDALDAHINDKNNPHQVTAAQVGLDKVDNTADIDKPISTAQQAVFDSISANLSNELDAKVNKSGDTLSGELTFSQNDTGFSLYGGARIYHKKDGSLVFRKDENDTDPVIESNDGSTQYKIWHEGNVGDGSGFNADKLDGYDSSNFLKTDDNATSASKLSDSRLLAVSGDAIGQSAFDGSADADIHIDLINSGVVPGTYNQVTVDSKGRVTTASNPTSKMAFVPEPQSNDDIKDIVSRILNQLIIHGYMEDKPYAPNNLRLDGEPASDSATIAWNWDNGTPSPSAPSNVRTGEITDHSVELFWDD